MKSSVERNLLNSFQVAIRIVSLAMTIAGADRTYDIEPTKPKMIEKQHTHTHIRKKFPSPYIYDSRNAFGFHRCPCPTPGWTAKVRARGQVQRKVNKRQISDMTLHYMHG